MKFFTIICSLMLFLSFSAQSQSALKQFEINIPQGLKQVKPDVQTDEILKLNYNNELFIIVQDNLGQLIKNSKTLGPKTAMHMVQKIKFMKLKSVYQGFDESEVISSTINENKFLSQSFFSKESFGKAYFEYRVMKIGENFYEFIITGKEVHKSKHKVMIDKFYNSIHPNTY